MFSLVLAPANFQVTKSTVSVWKGGSFKYFRSRNPFFGSKKSVLISARDTYRFLVLTLEIQTSFHWGSAVFPPTNIATKTPGKTQVRYSPGCLRVYLYILVSYTFFPIKKGHNGRLKPEVMNWQKQLFDASARFERLQASSCDDSVCFPCSLSSWKTDYAAMQLFWQFECRE